MHGKLRFWSGEAGETDGCRGECASNRDRGVYLDARCFEKICWSACIDGTVEIAGEVRAAQAPHAPVNPFSQ